MLTDEEWLGMEAAWDGGVCVMEIVACCGDTDRARREDPVEPGGEYGYAPAELPSEYCDISEGTEAGDAV